MVIEFDLVNGNCSLNNESILIDKEDIGLLSFSLSNDLDLVSFESSDSIDSDHLNLDIYVAVDFDSDHIDLITTTKSDYDGLLFDPKVYFFFNLGNLHLSPGPKVSGFSINVNKDGGSDQFDLDSSLFFKGCDGDSNFRVDSLLVLLNNKVHFNLVINNDYISFLSDSCSLNLDFDGPFGLKFKDESLISNCNSFNFLEIFHIDSLDSGPV
jgi:hypothetical protein